MSNCLFCEIINGEVGAYKIYEDDNVLVFLDKFPKAENPGHTLVIPKKHQELLYTQNFDFNILDYVNQTAKLLISKLGCAGIKIVNNNGKEAGQVIDHVHFHVIPYYENIESVLPATELEGIYEQLTK